MCESAFKVTKEPAQRFLEPASGPKHCRSGVRLCMQPSEAEKSCVPNGMNDLERLVAEIVRRTLLANPNHAGEQECQDRVERHPWPQEAPDPFARDCQVEEVHRHQQVVGQQRPESGSDATGCL